MATTVVRRWFLAAALVLLLALPSEALSQMVGDVAERLDRAALDHRAALLREVARDTGIESASGGAAVR